MDLTYCNGQKGYDSYYLGCDLKNYHMDDLSPKAFRRAYVAALFAEDQRWLTAIEKYQMLVPGSPKKQQRQGKGFGHQGALTGAGKLRHL